LRWWGNRGVFDYKKPGVSHEEQTDRHFGFSRVVGSPDYSKYPECLLELFFWNIMMPQVILVLILFALGFVIGFLVAKMKGSQ
jgi:hypothetical protein